MHGMRTLLFRVFVLAFWRSRSWEFEPGHPRRDGDLHDHRDDLREAVLHFLFFSLAIGYSYGVGEALLGRHFGAPCFSGSRPLARMV